MPQLDTHQCCDHSPPPSFTWQVANRIRAVPTPASAPGHTLTRVPLPMPTEAATLLHGFYAPFNAELAKLLGDERFLWKDV